MQAFPMFIRTTGRRVIVVGGGEQAAQKARLLLKTSAEIVVVSPDLCEELKGHARGDRITWHPDPVTADVFADAVFGFIATGCPGLDASVHGLAKAAGCLVNVVDQPALCDLTTPSIVDRDPVVVAIGTEGTGPVLARQIKTELEERLPQNLGGLAALAGHLRERVAKQVPRSRRRAFWRWVFAGLPGRAWARGDEADGTRAIEAAIAAHGAPDDTSKGSIALVGAGPGARDLLTLRAVQRLQEADVIYCDTGVDPELLELARRDAERIALSGEAAAAWRQNRIIADARRGNRVVHLTSGTPSAAQRAAYLSADVRVEHVPGVSTDEPVAKPRPALSVRA